MGYRHCAQLRSTDPVITEELCERIGDETDIWFSPDADNCSAFMDERKLYGGFASELNDCLTRLLDGHAWTCEVRGDDWDDITVLSGGPEPAVSERNNLAGRQVHKDATFIQYKGTDICMDFWCPGCGETTHFDGYFAYTVKCLACDKCWTLAWSVDVAEATEEEAENVMPDGEES